MYLKNIEMQLSDKDVKMLVKSEFYTFSNTWDLY